MVPQDSKSKDGACQSVASVQGISTGETRQGLVLEFKASDNVPEERVLRARERRGAG